MFDVEYSYNNVGARDYNNYDTNDFQNQFVNRNSFAEIYGKLMKFLQK